MTRGVFLSIVLVLAFAAGSDYSNAELELWRTDKKPTSIFQARLKLIYQAIHTAEELKASENISGPRTSGLNSHYILRLADRLSKFDKLWSSPDLSPATLNKAVGSDSDPKTVFIICEMLDHSKPSIRLEAAKLLTKPPHNRPIAAAPLLAALKRNNYPLIGLPDRKTQLAYRKAVWNALEKITGIKLIPIKSKSTTKPSSEEEPCAIETSAIEEISKWLIEVAAVQPELQTIRLKIEAPDAPCLLDLDTWRVDVPLHDVHGADKLQWRKLLGVDLVCRLGKNDKGPIAVLEGIALKTAEYKPTDKNDPKQAMNAPFAKIRRLLRGAKTTSSIPQDEFIFESSSGNVGALRIINADKNGLTLQYKIETIDPISIRKSLLVKPPKPKSTRRANPIARGREYTRSTRTVIRFKAFDRMLKKNGFVVTDEQFPQIFTAYIPEHSYWDKALPPFITTDSAWETYHVLLEEGVRQLEQQQAVRLEMFSRRLLAIAGDKQADFKKIAQYASIALALQDKKHAASIPKADKQLLAALKEGSGTVRGPVGFPLLGAVFRANSFYASNPKLADYSSARQWYAMIVFPANDRDATSLAIRLAMLIDSDKELRGLWDALSAPYDTLVAKAEDGDVRTYAAAVRKVVGPKATPAQVAKSIEALQKHLQTALPDPQINDQLLGENQYANFATLIKGFRLLPPRRLPSAACLQRTAPSGLGFPSALNFMVTCKQMKSPAAVRALEQQIGEKRAAKIQHAAPCKLPDSLHGKAMKLIAALQKPVPAAAPRAMKTQAWSDKQLWTQLGAWSQQRHTWALHARMTVNPLGGPEQSDAGMVSPYPEFFESLGVLTRQTAAMLPNEIDVKPLSKSLLRNVKTYASILDSAEDGSSSDWMDRMLIEDYEIGRIHDLLDKCKNEHRALLGLSANPSDARILKYLGNLARKCIESGKASKQGAAILRTYAGSGNDVVNLMGQFADICDKLATIARKQLGGKPLNKKENRLIRNYGPILARLQFYEKFSYFVPRNDSPIITPVFVNPRAGRTLYAALGRPRALYVRAELNGQTKLMLGAVLSYREFTHPISAPLDDEGWRRFVQSETNVPEPPEFTKSFVVRPSEGEIVEMLEEGEIYSSIDNIKGAKITQKLLTLLSTSGRHDRSALLYRLRSRCTESNAAALLKFLHGYLNTDSEEMYKAAEQMMDLMGDSPCKTIAPELMQMLAAKDSNHAHAAAYILSKQPELIDPEILAANYDRLTRSKRALHLYLLGLMPRADKTARNTMLKAMRDRYALVRWHATVALGRYNSEDPTVIKALNDRINDNNMYVAGAAIQSLAKLDASPDAETLTRMLKTFISSYWRSNCVESQKKAIEFPQGGEINIFRYGFRCSLPVVTLPDNRIVEALVQLKHKEAIPVIMEILSGDGFPPDSVVFYLLRDLDREGYPDRLLTLASNDKLDTDLRIEAIERLPYNDHPIRACRRLASLIPDRTKPSLKTPNSSSTAVENAAIMTIAEFVFPKEYEESYGDESDGGMFTVQSDDDADKKRREKQYQKRLKSMSKLVRHWIRSTTQPAGK